MAANGKGRKKKRISKHVLSAKQEQAATDPEDQGNPGSLPGMPKPASASSKQKKLNKAKVKDPKEAAAYLSAWKHRDTVAWKFNKNTQSWLIRHMYEAEVVSKPTFAVLLEYLTGLQGKTRNRLIEDAQRRALRYKDFERSLDSKEVEGAEEAQHGKSDGNVEESATSGIESMVEDDESRWKKLNTHDKRKQYKRARKILDELQK